MFSKQLSISALVACAYWATPAVAAEPRKATKSTSAKAKKAAADAKAKKATDDANKAAEEARKATDDANKAAEEARKATDDANKAAEEANKAGAAKTARAKEKDTDPLGFFNISAGPAFVVDRDDNPSWTLRFAAGPALTQTQLGFGFTTGYLGQLDGCGPNQACSSVTAWDIGIMAKLNLTSENAGSESCWSIIQAIAGAFELTPTFGVAFVDAFTVELDEDTDRKRRNLTRRAGADLAVGLGVAFDPSRLIALLRKSDDSGIGFQLGARGMVLVSPLDDDALYTFSPFLAVRFQ